MARRTPRYCKTPGCYRPSVSKGMCPDCAAKTATAPRVVEARGTTSARGYDLRWQRCRHWFIAQHPLCAICSEPAEEVHHVIPLPYGARLEAGNLRSLCKRCHDAVGVAQRQWERQHADNWPSPDTVWAWCLARAVPSQP